MGTGMKMENRGARLATARRSVRDLVGPPRYIGVMIAHRIFVDASFDDHLAQALLPLVDGTPPGHMRDVCAKLFRAKAIINPNMLRTSEGAD